MAHITEKSNNLKAMLSVLVFAQAVITKQPSLGGLNNRHRFLSILEAGKSAVRMPAWSGSGESPLPNEQVSTCLLHLQVAEGAGLWDIPLLIKGSKQMMKTLSSRLLLNVIAFQRPHLQTPSLCGGGGWGWGFNTCILRGHKHSS